MDIEGFKVIRQDDGYYCNIPMEGTTREDTGPVLTIERISKEVPARWRATIINGPWCENIAFEQFGSFNRCSNQLKRAVKEKQHIST